MFYFFVNLIVKYGNAFKLKRDKHIKPWIKLNNSVYILYQNLLLSSFLSFSRNPLSSIQSSLKYLDLKIKKKLKYINIKLMILKESHALKIHEIVPRDIPKQYYFY